MKHLLIEEVPSLDMEELVKTYKRLFSTEDGKAVLADLQSTHRMLSTSYAESINEVVYNEGERNVILRIMHIINTDLEALRAERQSTED